MSSLEWTDTIVGLATPEGEGARDLFSESAAPVRTKWWQPSVRRVRFKQILFHGGIDFVCRSPCGWDHGTDRFTFAFMHGPFIVPPRAKRWQKFTFP